jgi:hypothetical protein
VKVHDGNSPLAPLLADYDGCDDALPVFATSGNMFITFFSDFSVTDYGFNATIASN